MNRVLAKSVARPVRRVQAFAFAEKTPPAEVQLWNVGDNPTDYGVHRWTDRSVLEVMSRYESRGNPILVDVEHNGATAGGDDPPVIGGYAALEIRGGAPWLVFDWSEYAVEQIATGQRRFLSPEYDVDTDTGEIVRLYRVSLVADPATYRARMLASAAEAARKGDNTVNLAMILAALRAALAAEDPAVAKESITNLVAELSKESDGAPAAEPPTDGEPPPSAEDVNAAGATPPPPPAAPKKDGDKPVAAAAPAPVEPPPPVAPVAAVAAAAQAPDPNTTRVLAELDSIKRDALLRDEGDRLPEPVRVWAAAQPYEVVKSLVSASPKRLAPVGQVRATRGERHGLEDAHRRGLEGKELEELQRAMGTFRASTPAVPHVNSAGDFVLPLRTPTEAREQAAAKKGGV